MVGDFNPVGVCRSLISLLAVYNSMSENYAETNISTASMMILNIKCYFYLHPSQAQRASYKLQGLLRASLIKQDEKGKPGLVASGKTERA